MSATPIKVTVVEDKGSSHSGAKQVLVTDGSGFFLVSSVISHDMGEPETLVFKCGHDGRVEKWTQVAGGINQSRSQAIADLEKRLNDATLGAPDLIEAFYDKVGGPIGALCSVLDGVSGRTRPRPVDDEFLK